MTPTISRTLDVDSTPTCWELHDVIQRVFGWQNTHLHRFHPGLPKSTDEPSGWLGVSQEVSLVIGDTEDEERDEVWWEEMLDEHDITVGQLLAMGRGMATYVYDFGDFWQHTITVADAIEPTEWTPRARVVESTAPSAVEDCGGSDGLTRLLGSLADPLSKTHRDAWDQLRFMRHPGMRGCDFRQKSITTGPLDWGSENEELQRWWGHFVPEVPGQVLCGDPVKTRIDL